MRFYSSPPIYLLVIGATLLFFSFTFAVPTGSSIVNPASPVQPVKFLSQPSDPQRPWIRLRNWLIETVWGIRKSSSKHSSSGNCPHLSRKKTLIRYGSDVVLRFHLHNVDDMAAITEATDTLLLDIWASTNEFVDIRLARETVSDASSYENCCHGSF